MQTVQGRNTLWCLSEWLECREQRSRRKERGRGQARSHGASKALWRETPCSKSARLSIRAPFHKLPKAKDRLFS